MPKNKSDTKIAHKLTKPVALAAILAGFALPPRVAEASKLMPPVAEDETFALELLRRLPSDRNQVFSPYSISLAFAMVHAGAAGSTADEIAKLFQHKEKPETLHSSLSSEAKTLMARAQQSGETLSIANRLSGAKSLEFLPEYLELLKTQYDAQLDTVDFSSPATRDAAARAINAWVSEKTQGKIPRIVDARQMNPSTRLLLVNAIHLLSKWETPFDANRTRDLPFLSDGSISTNIKTMQSESLLRYSEKRGLYQAVALDYTTPGLSMIVILPAKKSSTKQLVTRIQPGDLRSLLKNTNKEKVDLHLPRFNTKSSLSMKDHLSGMGIHAAFSPQADLSRMAKPGPLPLAISSVVHEAMIDVGEKGTEAAAATAITAFYGAAYRPPGPKKTFHVDRPFLFMIRDEISGRILFFGQIVDPRSA